MIQHSMKLTKPTGLTASDDIERKLKLAEEVAILDEAGQESEKKAAKIIIEEGKKGLEEDKKFEVEKLENLQSKSRYQFLNYKHYLADIIGQIMRNRAICPKGWLWDAWANNEGVGLTIMSLEKRKFVKAFKPVNIPKYDLNACAILCMEAENTVGKYEDTVIHKLSNLNGHTS